MDRANHAACTSEFGFPHTRGDGPWTPTMSPHSILFSPHAWGWTGNCRAPNSPSNVFPTRVGMDRCRPGLATRSSGFPHTRGDGPVKEWSASKQPMFSPHAWGWTVLDDFPSLIGRVFPTRVGMDRRHRVAASRRPGFPHTRGDGPVIPTALAGEDSFSPHAWGWTAPDRTAMPGQPVFPTRVGMDRSRSQAAGRSGCFPHTRGDGPAELYDYRIDKRFSPHAWGWTGQPTRWTAAGRVFPARVGMDGAGSRSRRRGCGRAARPARGPMSLRGWQRA